VAIILVRNPPPPFLWLRVCRVKRIRSERLVSGGGVRVGWVNAM